MAKVMLQKGLIASVSSEDSNLVQGQIAEVICLLQIEEFMKLKGITDWSVHKGLIFRSLEENSKYLTEIDIVIFSPVKIFSVEIKSNSGEKTVKDECTLVYGRRSRDIFSQHYKHEVALLSMFRDFRSPRYTDSESVTSLVYIFADGSLTDTRTAQNKKRMPVVDETSLLPLLEKEYQGSIKWDMNYVRRAVTILETKKSNLTKKHLNYVKSLGHGN